MSRKNRTISMTRTATQIDVPDRDFSLGVGQDTISGPACDDEARILVPRFTHFVPRSFQICSGRFHNASMRFTIFLLSVALFAGPQVDPITPANVARLKIVWTYDTGEAIDHFRRD